MFRVKHFHHLMQRFSNFFFCDPKSQKQRFTNMTATQINLSEHLLKQNEIDV